MRSLKTPSKKVICADIWLQRRDARRGPGDKCTKNTTLKRRTRYISLGTGYFPPTPAIMAPCVCLYLPETPQDALSEVLIIPRHTFSRPRRPPIIGRDKDGPCPGTWPLDGTLGPGVGRDMAYRVASTRVRILLGIDCSSQCHCRHCPPFSMGRNWPTCLCEHYQTGPVGRLFTFLLLGNAIPPLMARWKGRLGRAAQRGRHE